MHVFEKAEELAAFLQPYRTQNQSIGFVPTMGALHAGHLSLVQHALRENDLTVVSIFVNPTQFNNSEDLARYPRVPETDLQQLKTLKPLVVFLPEVKEMYPQGLDYAPTDLQNLDQHMEGHFRPGHFQGVATVVSRFFDMVRPHRAYFGEKDFQQLQIIRHITQQRHPETDIVPHPIERNQSGLALSSRNALMSDEDRERSEIIFSVLNWCQEHFREYTPAGLQEAVQKQFAQSTLTLEYALACNPQTLQPLEHWDDAPHARFFIAAYMGKVRLIDNISLF